MANNIIIGVIGVIIAVLTYIAGTKKTSNEEVEKRAYFEGQIGAKLDQVLHSLEKLESKVSKNTEELYNTIEKRIEEHERRFHGQ